MLHAEVTERELSSAHKMSLQTLKAVHFMKLRLCSHYTGSIFCPVWKSFRYNVSRSVLVWQNKPRIESKRVTTRFRSKNGADPLNSPFTLGAERSKKLSDTEHITFGI